LHGNQNILVFPDTVTFITGLLILMNAKFHLTFWEYPTLKLLILLVYYRHNNRNHHRCCCHCTSSVSGRTLSTYLWTGKSGWELLTWAERLRARAKNHPYSTSQSLRRHRRHDTSSITNQQEQRQKTCTYVADMLHVSR